MSFLEKIKSDLQDYLDEVHRDRHPYLMPQAGLFGVAWKVMRGADGCRPVQTQKTMLMEKNPAPLPKEIPLAGPTHMPAHARSIEKSTDGRGTVESKSLVSNDSKNSLQSDMNSNKKEECPQLPPFDMMDLPQAMNELGFKYSARCAERWFNGKSHEISDGSRVIEFPQYVDAENLKINWLLKFGTVRRRYEHLQSTKLKKNESQNIYNDSAQEKLAKILKDFMAHYRDRCPDVLNAWDKCNKDIQELHRNFQFQFAGVSMLDAVGDKWKIAENELRGISPMNDLAASLANFNFYAAIAKARFSTTQNMYYGTNPWKVRRHTVAEVTHIFLYAKDIYSFNDKTDISQYLGHWNRHGVIVAYDVYAAEKLKLKAGDDSRSYLPPIPPNLDKPVDVGSSLKDKEVFYPVRNRDFRSWRQIKKQRRRFFDIFRSRDGKASGADHHRSG
jgi:hypothetical protein